MKCERGVSYKPEKAMVGGRSGATGGSGGAGERGRDSGRKKSDLQHILCVCVHTLHPTKCMKKRLLHFIIASTLGILPQR